MTNKTTLTLLLSLSSACGLLKVNGKTLGGGGGSTQAQPEATEDHSNESGAEYEARQQRTYDAQEKKQAADKAGQPEICGQYAISNARDIKLEDFANLEDSKRDWKYSAKDFAEVMCSTRGKNLELRPKVMALRDKWMKQHGLDENDFLVVLVEGMGRGWESQDRRTMAGAVGQMNWPSEIEMDKLGARASMLGRISYVERCLQLKGEGGMLKKILCAAEPLDAKKALAEIEAAQDINIQTRFHLRQTVQDTIADQKTARAELATIAKDEPGVARLIAIADMQHKEWAAPSAARAKTIKLVEAMEAATAAKKTSGFAGCEAATRAVWSEVVKSTEIPTVSHGESMTAMIAAVFKTPEAYMAYRALEMCATGIDAKFTPEFDILGIGSTRRGARTGSVAAWMAAAGDIKFDSKELTMADLFRNLGTRDGVLLGDVVSGTIATVVPKGAFLEVTFKKEFFEEESCVASRQTGRILRIESSGSVSYEHVCTKYAMVKFDATPDPVTLSGMIGQGLSPGMMFMVSKYGFPIAATANAKAKKPVWVFGVTR